MPKKMDVYEIGEEVLIAAKIESREFDNHGNVVYNVTIKGSRGECPYHFEHDMIIPKNRVDTKNGTEKAKNTTSRVKN